MFEFEYIHINCCLHIAAQRGCISLRHYLLFITVHNTVLEVKVQQLPNRNIIYFSSRRIYTTARRLPTIELAHIHIIIDKIGKCLLYVGNTYFIF